jgi:hypothetical protein
LRGVSSGSSYIAVTAYPSVYFIFVISESENDMYRSCIRSKFPIRGKIELQFANHGLHERIRLVPCGCPSLAIATSRLGGFLLPPEVVSCSYLPEPGLCAHCVRLLREQWESEARHLASIPEEPIGSCAHLSCACCLAHTRAHTHIHIIDYNIL